MGGRRRGFKTNSELRGGLRQLHTAERERERERERSLSGNNVHDGGVQGAAQ